AYAVAERAGLLRAPGAGGGHARRDRRLAAVGGARQSRRYISSAAGGVGFGERTDRRPGVRAATLQHAPGIDADAARQAGRGRDLSGAVAGSGVAGRDFPARRRRAAFRRAGGGRQQEAAARLATAAGLGQVG